MKNPFSFDGHGINDADGIRVCKVCSCGPYTYPNGVPERNREFDALSNLFAAAPDLLAACQGAIACLASGDLTPEMALTRLRKAVALAEGRLLLSRVKPEVR